MCAILRLSDQTPISICWGSPLTTHHTLHVAHERMVLIRRAPTSSPQRSCRTSCTQISSPGNRWKSLAPLSVVEFYCLSTLPSSSPGGPNAYQTPQETWVPVFSAQNQGQSSNETLCVLPASSFAGRITWEWVVAT